MSGASPSDRPEFDRYCTVTIQGGGIYGITLLGQLQAVEEAGLIPVAYIGTSAGAVISALAWAGYGPAEILEKLTEKLQSQGLIHLLGPFERRLCHFEIDPPWLRRFVNQVKKLGAASVGGAVSTSVGQTDKRKGGTSKRPPVGWAACAFCHLVEAGVRIFQVTYRAIVGAAQLAMRGAIGAARFVAAVCLWPFRFLCSLASRIGFVRRFAIWAGKKLGWAWLVGRWLGGMLDFGIRKLARAYGKLAMAFTIAHGLWYVWPAITRRSGLFSGAEFARFIDDLLREKLCTVGVDVGDRSPTFADFRAAMFPQDGKPRLRPASLFLTMTNVTQGDLRLVSSLEEAFQCRSVSEVVRASAGFPLFFQPTRMQLAAGAGEQTFIDGGMIANFPLWLAPVHVREVLYESSLAAAAYRPFIHVGLRLITGEEAAPGAEPETQAADHQFKYYANLIDLLMGGTRTRLEERLVEYAGRTAVVNQPRHESGAPGGTLAFEKLTQDNIARMYACGLEAGKRRFGDLQFALPAAAAIDEILARLASRAEYLLKQAGAVLDGKVRANVFVLEGTTLVLRYAVNMDGDTDRNLRLPLGQGLTSLAFMERHSLLVSESLNDGKNGPFSLPDDQQALIRSGTNWLMARPILDTLETGGPTKAPGPRSEALNVDKSGAMALGPFGPERIGLIGASARGVPFGTLNIDAVIKYGAVDEYRTAPFPTEADQQMTLLEIICLNVLMQEAGREIGFVLGAAFGAGRADAA